MNRLSPKKATDSGHCKCDCGNDVWVRANILKAGKTVSCGCLTKDLLRKKGEDLRGRRFGRLIVLNEDYRVNSSTKHREWHCKCDCGNDIWVDAGSLKKGNTKSCGCYHKERVSEAVTNNLRGQKFGRLTVLDDEPRSEKRENGTRLYWHCKCECGNDLWTAGDALTSGHTKSCGCLNAEIREEMNRRNYVEGTSINNLLAKTPKTNPNNSWLFSQNHFS